MASAAAMFLFSMLLSGALALAAGAAINDVESNSTGDADGGENYSYGKEEGKHGASHAGWQQLIFLLALWAYNDVLRLNDLWDENYPRRMLHHLVRNSYNPQKKPWIHFIKNGLQKEHIKTIIDLQEGKETAGIATSWLAPYLSRILGGHISKKCSMYHNDFDDASQNILDAIGEAMLPQLEKIAGCKLYLGTSNFRSCVVRYEGESCFPWHYDTEPETCFRTIFLIHKKGKIAPFSYRDECGNVKNKSLQIGEGIFFKGTRTHHHVREAGDPKAERYIAGWQYSSDKVMVEPPSLCSELRGANVPTACRTLLPPMFMMICFSNLTYGFLPGTSWSLSPWLVLLTCFTFVFTYLVPPKISAITGTGVAVHPGLGLFFLFWCWCNTLQPDLTLLMYNYVVLTEALAPARFVQWS